MRSYLALAGLIGVTLALLLAGALTQPSLARFTDPANVTGNTLTTNNWTSVQSGTTTSSGVGTVTINISTVDPAKSFLIFESRHNSNRPPASEIRGRIASATTLEFTRVTDETSTMNIDWSVVSNPKINVQRGELNQAATTVNTAITPVTSLNQAFVTWSKTPVSTDQSFGTDDPILGELTTTSNLQFRANASNSSHIISWQVIEYQYASDINVQKGVTSLTGTALSTTATLGTAVDVNKTFVLAGYRTSGTGTDAGTNMLRAQLTDATTLSFDRSISGPGISRVSAWTTGLTHTVGSGSSRALLFAVGYENSADVGVSSVTYGGQTLTRINGAVAGTGPYGRAELWHLNEAGIAAATGTGFIVTWGGVAPTDPMYAAASYANVNQTTPIFNSSTNFSNTATPNPITTGLNVVNGAMAVSATISGNGGSYTWNNGWALGTDQQSNATTDMSSAEKVIVADGTDTASATHSGPNRQAIAAATLNPVTSDLSEIAWQAIELKDGSSVQRGSQNFAAGVAQQTVAITGVTAARAIAFASVQSVGGQNMGRSPYAGDDIIGVCSVTMAVTSSTQITMDRNSTVSSCDVGWFVIDFAVGPPQIAFRAAASAGVASGNLTISKPAGTVTGDVMIASIAVRPQTTTIGPPGGWALVRRMDNATANQNSLAVYSKVAGGSEPSSYTWTISANTGAAGGIASFSGVDTSSPINIENGQNTANALTHTAPSVTTTSANTMLFTSHAFTSAATWSPPGQMAEVFDQASIAVPNAGGIAIEGNYVFQSNAGATGSKQATANNDADVGNAHILALKRAP